MDSAKWIVMVLFFTIIVCSAQGAVDKEVPKLPVEIYRLDGPDMRLVWKMELYIEYLKKQLQERYPERFKENE